MSVSANISGMIRDAGVVGAGEPAPGGWMSGLARPQRNTLMAAQGVTMKAMASDQNIAALDPMGMGRM